MENFAGATGALDEYSIFQFDAKRSRFHSNLNKAATFIHAGPRAGKCYKFLFLTNEDRLQLFCYKAVLCYQCVE